jgi:hypothetical protein
MSENSTISRLGAQGPDDIREQLECESRSRSRSKSQSSSSESKMVENQVLGIPYESDSSKSDRNSENYINDDFMGNDSIIVSGNGSQNSTEIAARLARAKQHGIEKFVFKLVDFDDVITSAWTDCFHGCALKELKMMECSGQRDVVLQCRYENMSLEGMHLSNSDARALNTTLRRTTPGLNSLEMLGIGSVDDEACAILTEGLQNNTTLETLFIDDSSPTTDLEVAKLLRALSSHPKLRKLELIKGHQGGQEAVKALGHLLATSELEDLGFIPRFTLENRVLASALRGNQCLRKLNLLMNHLGDEALDPLAHAISTCRVLEVLDLRHNQLRDADLETLLSRLPCTLKSLDVSQNKFTQHQAEKLMLTALEENPQLSMVRGVRGRDIRHSMDFNWIGRKLFCDRSDLPISVWPVVLGRAIRLGSVRSPNAIFHMLQGTQPSGSLLSVLVRRRLSEK